LCAAGACAQARFEVAAIKPSNADAGHSGFDTDGGSFTASNVTLKRCIMSAYGIGPNQVVGGPEWLDAERFQITAKADHPPKGQELMLMQQTLLADRFKLALHRETRPMHAYVIEVAKNGPKLEKGGGEGSSTDSGRGQIKARNCSMDRLAQGLARQMDLPVVNHTGLEGVYNFTLQWTPESAEAKADAGPSIFTAIQEQLGLRLRAETAPVEVLVIDHAERPTEN
jgi:uncharacterized protein (TIGR03435 family)